MALTGLPDKILAAVQYIEWGRKGFITDGKEYKGRIYYEKGIAAALAVFQKDKLTDDPKSSFLTN